MDVSYKPSSSPTSTTPSVSVMAETTTERFGLQQGNRHWKSGGNESSDWSYSSTDQVQSWINEKTILQGPGLSRGNPHWDPGDQHSKNNISTTPVVEPSTTVDNPLLEVPFSPIITEYQHPGSQGAVGIAEEFDHVQFRTREQENVTWPTAIPSDRNRKSPATTDQTKSLWVSDGLQYDCKPALPYSDEDLADKSCFVSDLNSSKLAVGRLLPPLLMLSSVSNREHPGNRMQDFEGVAKDETAREKRENTVPGKYLTSDTTHKGKTPKNFNKESIPIPCTDKDQLGKACFVSGLNTAVSFSETADLSLYTPFPQGNEHTDLLSRQPSVKPFVCYMEMRAMP